MSTQDEKIKALSEQETEKLLGKEAFRKRINEIICEYIEKVQFSDLIKKYAGEEMDKRVFRSMKYWAVVIITALLGSVIGVIVTHFTTKQ